MSTATDLQQPTLFLPHGAPDLAVSRIAAHHFLGSVAATLPAPPRGILIISAHWEERMATITSHPTPPTVHDFAGFSRELNAMHYPARTDPALLDRTLELLHEAGFEPRTDASRGFDHGVWVPLLLAWPAADVPVVQLSLLRGGTPAEHLRLGSALEPLGLEGWLVIGSGSTTHSLRDLAREGSPPPDWAQDFDNWLYDNLTGNPTGDGLTNALHPHTHPHYSRAHPSPEHLLPLYVALGAAGQGSSATRTHASFSWGSVGMSAYRFERDTGATG